MSRVARWMIGVLLAAPLGLACGSDRKKPDVSNAPGGESGDSHTAAAGGAATGRAGNGGTAGGSGRGGTESGGGNGALDATCMTRTTNQIPGSRIVLRNVVTAEGDKAFVGLYDTLKEVECKVYQDAEGKFRCWPLATGKDLKNRYFLDQNCSDEVEYRAECALDYQAERVSSADCDDRLRFYPLGDPLPDALVYWSAGGECKPYGTLNHLYKRGPELVPSEYAELKPVVWRGAGRIWVAGYEGDGGLHFASAF